MSTLTKRATVYLDPVLHNFLHGSACGGRVREKKDAVNGYEA